MGFLAAGLAVLPSASAGDDDAKRLTRFERVVIDANFPGGYQVEVADVNGDGKPDIIAVGGGVCAWFENPAWKKRIVTNSRQTPGIISSATADINGDGKAEIAIAYEFAMNEPMKGKLLLAEQRPGPEDSWNLTQIADVGSIHRLRWLRSPAGEERRPPTLVVAPIFGPSARPPTFNQEPAHITLVSLPEDTQLKKNAGQGWQREVIADRPVLHAIEVPGARFGWPGILTADNLGVALVHRENRGDSKRWLTRNLASGADGEAPKRGCSEIHLGRLADQRRYLATIDPWHGSEVAVCLEVVRADSGVGESKQLSLAEFGPRTAIDNTLADGHALWVADVDGDGDDEILAGHRGRDHRVSVFDFDGAVWKRQIIDHEIAAQDLRGGDLDGDGKPDVVAIGGSTHNVVWYRPVADEAKTFKARKNVTSIY
jgi:hypothetical protein